MVQGEVNNSFQTHKAFKTLDIKQQDFLVGHAKI